MSRPSIAIIGRPNVGKSTLFNRLVEKRKAIVDAKEGITRDRIRGTLEWENRLYDIIDTGGYIPDDVDVFNSAVREQSELAIQEADFILFLVGCHFVLRWVLLVKGHISPTILYYIDFMYINKMLLLHLIPCNFLTASK